MKLKHLVSDHDIEPSQSLAANFIAEQSADIQTNGKQNLKVISDSFMLNQSKLTGVKQEFR